MDNNIPAGVDVSLWQGLSEAVQIARNQQRASTVNDDLLNRAKLKSDSVIGPCFVLWAADNLRLESRFEEAIEIYKLLQAVHGGRTFVDVDFEATALENLASCHERLGNIDDALSSLVALAKQSSAQSAWAWYEVGRVADAAERKEDAARAFLRASSMPETRAYNSFPMQELAKRAAMRLNDTGDAYVADPNKLAITLARTFRSGDMKTARSLGSRSYFTVGIAGAHREFVNFEEVYNLLQADLAVSRTRVDYMALSGQGQRRYLKVDGWNGDWANGTLWLLLSQRPHGWNWTGVIFSVPSQAWLAHLQPEVKEKNQPLSISIKAPWPNGQNFTAGGLAAYLNEQFNPFVAWTIPFLALGDCGFGPGGFYYNMGSTHVGTDAFAIDFTRYQRGVPYWNISGTSPILACFQGVVTFARGTVRSGDPDMDNRVGIRHTNVDFSSRLPRLIRLPYLSKSLHLQGPEMVPVSRTMFVRQGARLGIMDDTGNSAFDHLHFSIHDDNIGGNNVRPSPLDGQRLIEEDSGRCVSSTNVPFP